MIVNSGSGFRYIPALDGLRAIAVLGVLLYHADLSWLPGGFLGVEVFFVVSGYLITSLLMAEHASSGGTDLLAFWLRRARRLFPALWCLLLAVPAYAALRLPEELYELRHDLAGALLYATNWQLIWANQSYFEQLGRPSLLKHLWSLAVEEQFYLLWPVLFSLLLAKARARVAALWLLVAALLSALWMGHLHDPSVDPSRVYYGSDTRAFGLLLGGALALGLPSFVRRLQQSHALALAGVGSLGLGYGFGWLDELSPFVYPYGLLIVGCATLALIAGGSLAEAPPARLLAQPLLVAIGKRSYSLYLWHWPVFMVTRPGLDLGLSGVANLLLRLVLTALLAELSYRYVELPVRHGALSQLLPTPRELSSKTSLGSRAKPRASSAPLFKHLAPLACALLVLGFNTRALVFAEQAAPQSLLLSAPLGLDTLHASGAPSPFSQGPTTGEPLPTQPTRVLAIGDSVMLGARKYLAQPGMEIEVDAEVGRTPLITLALLKKRKARGDLADVVIIHLGNNGPFQAEHFDRMMGLLQEVQHVVFVTAKVPRRLGDFNNRTIREGALRHPRVELVDWYHASKDHTKWFRTDGLHLNETGASEYAALLAQHYGSAPAR